MKKRNFFLLVMMTSLLGLSAVAQTAEWPASNREAKAGSRWWWMGSAVDDASLDWNIREYARTGIGTLEITPIYGVQGNTSNELSFLSTPWMNALKKVQQVADEVGVDIDMNCGTGWPFGGPTVKIDEAAGKLVTKTDVLTANGTDPITYNVSSPESYAKLNKVMAYKDDEAIDVTAFVQDKTLQWTAPEGQWRIIAIYNGHTQQQVKRAAPGGEGYVLDHYDADAVAHYLQRFDNAFAQSEARWPHSFFNDSYEVYGADWTPKMFDEFLKYHGYRLEDHMPELLGLKKDTDYQVLADYRQTLSDMLLNNFTRQWTEWAHSHGATTRNQGHGSPGNLIDFYAAVDIPEIEGFGLTDFKIRGLRTDPGFVRQNYSDFATLKYASSAAHITGKPLTSSETFTWLTEHFRTSLSQMKPDLDLMFVAGVNHMLFHGTTYTPQSAAWPGWKFYASIDMSPTNSIWRDAPYLMQYIERCQSFLQMGQPDNDLLVYAPFTNAMHKSTSSRLLLFDINSLSQKMPEVVKAVTAIEKVGLDCDYVSDALLLQTTADNGKLRTPGGCCYTALVVPTTNYMPTDVKNHLTALEEQGIRIIYGTTDDLIATSGAQPEALRTQLGLRVIRRQHDTGHHYFIANLSARDVEGFVPLAVDFQSAAFFNPLNGTVEQAVVSDDGVYVNLRSGESIILKTENGGVSAIADPRPVKEVAPQIIEGEWTLSFTEDTYPQDRLQPAYQLPSLQTWETLDAATAQAMGTGIYETTFSVDSRLLNMAEAGFRLNLGDVRESARVYVNGEYLGCAWSAPFTIDCPVGLIHEGNNTLRIEVTNLPANRIRQMDADGQKWRIFGDVNILDIVNGSEGSSGVTSYASWQLMPSGLNSTVQLVPLQLQKHALNAELTGFVNEGDDYFPVYRLSPQLSTANCQLSTVNCQQSGYTGFDFELTADGAALIILREPSNDYVDFCAPASNGNTYHAYLKAAGAYRLARTIDFTSDEEPLCGWIKLNNLKVQGFEDTTVPTYRSKKGGKQVTELYQDVTFTAETSCDFFFQPGYGMGVTKQCNMTVKTQEGAVAMMTYLVGSNENQPYNASDSLKMFSNYQPDLGGVVFELNPRTQYYIYRHFMVYEPKAAIEGIKEIENGKWIIENDIYDLQGRRIYPHSTLHTPHSTKKGIYISKGKKIVIR